MSGWMIYAFSVIHMQLYMFYFYCLELCMGVRSCKFSY